MDSSQNGKSSQVMDLVLAAMMEELGKQRLDELPMEDNHDRLHRQGPSHRGNGPCRAPRIPRTPQPRADGTDAGSNFRAAIAAGDFNDADAEAVRGLSILGGGRIYANTPQQEVRRAAARETLSQHLLSNMDPMTMQTQRQPQPPRPEIQTAAALGFESRGLELPPGRGLILSSAPTSNFGAVLGPNMPVQVHRTNSNRLRDRTYATMNGRIIHDILQPLPARRPAARHTMADVQRNPVAISSQNTSQNTSRNISRNTSKNTSLNTSRRSQTLITSSAPQAARNVPATGTLLDTKRQTAVFEACVKYIKVASTNPTKFVWAIVILTPAGPPYMGYLFIFLKKEKERPLERELPLNLVRAQAGEDDKVVLRIKENEIRESSSRIIFESSNAARDFLLAISRLLGGVADLIATGFPVPVGTVSTTSSSPGLDRVQADHDPLPTMGSEATSNQVITAANVPCQLEFGENKSSADTQNLVFGAAAANTGDTETLTSVDPDTIRLSDGAVSQTSVDGHGVETENIGNKAPILDLLSGSEDTFSDMASPVTVAQHTTNSTNSEDRDFASPLFDLAIAEHSSQIPSPVYKSNIDQLQGLDFGGHIDACNTEGNHDGQEDIEEVQDSSSVTLVAAPAQGAHGLVHLMQDMFRAVLTGFGNAGIAGITDVERKRTETKVKQDVATTVRGLATNPAFFAGLTSEEKLEVIKEWVSEPEDTEMIPGTDTAEDFLVQVAGGLYVSSSVTAADTSPSRQPRKEYSAKQLLDARGDAVQPPDWLNKLPFLPRAPAIEPSETYHVQDSPLNNMALDKPVTQVAAKEDIFKQDNVEQATLSESSTPLKKSTTQNIPIKDANRVTRPAAPPTPAASPSTAVAPPAANIAKLEHRFERLTLKDKPAAMPSMTPLERAKEVVPAVLATQLPANSVPTGDKSDTVHSVEHPANLEDPKMTVSGFASSREQAVQKTQCKDMTSASKDLSTVMHELKTKIHATAFDFTKQPQPGQPTEPANGRKNVPIQRSTTTAAKSITPSNDTTHEKAPVCKPTRGLNSSRWAKEATQKVEREGRFTGVNGKK